MSTTHTPALVPSASASAPTVSRVVAVRRFTLHYLEMVVAMVVGMVALGPLESLAFEALGWTGVTGRGDVGAMLMAANMTVAMAAWMRFRGHRWAPVVEMSAAMFLPFAVLLVPLWLGAMTEHGLMMWGHVLMLLGMAAAMLLRREEYVGHHCS